MNIILLIIALYVGSVTINYWAITRGNLFNLNSHIGFTILYLLLSPVTVIFSIGRALEFWYSHLEDIATIVKALQIGIEETKYHSLSKQDLIAVKDYLTLNLEFAEYDNFEEIFTALEERGVIGLGEDGNYHYIYEE